MNISFTIKEFSDKMLSSVTALGYTVDHIDFVSDGVIKLWLSAKDGIPVTGQFPFIVLCATHELTIGAHKHRSNYYYWQEGLAKLATPNFWLRRDGSIRGACTDDEKQRCNRYDDDHRAEKRVRSAEYYEAHRDEASAYYEAHRDYRLSYLASYRASHRDDAAAKAADYYASHREEAIARQAVYNAQLWSNGTETLKWSTLLHRGRKADLLAAGWHPIN